jgi:hypothetical protein
VVIIILSNRLTAFKNYHRMWPHAPHHRQSRLLNFSRENASSRLIGRIDHWITGPVRRRWEWRVNLSAAHVKNCMKVFLNAWACRLPFDFLIPRSPALR